MQDTIVLAYYYQNNNIGNNFIIMKRRELFVSTLHGQTCRSVENKHFIKLTICIRELAILMEITKNSYITGTLASPIRLG